MKMVEESELSSGESHFMKKMDFSCSVIETISVLISAVSTCSKASDCFGSFSKITGTTKAIKYCVKCSIGYSSRSDYSLELHSSCAFH